MLLCSAAYQVSHRLAWCMVCSSLVPRPLSEKFFRKGSGNETRFVAHVARWWSPLNMMPSFINYEFQYGVVAGLHGFCTMHLSVVVMSPLVFLVGRYQCWMPAISTWSTFSTSNEYNIMDYYQSFWLVCTIRWMQVWHGCCNTLYNVWCLLEWPSFHCCGYFETISTDSPIQWFCKSHQNSH